MRAIISVSDKKGVAEFARSLSGLGYELFSTGGTKKAIAEAGVEVKSISEITGFPEILDGRVKTLHPMVHGGILARRDLPSHLEELEKNKIQPIDLVAVNLYPFVKTVTANDVKLEEALENIDIGGPTLIRATAKNFLHVLPVVDPADYAMVIEGLKEDKLDAAARKTLAQKAFQHVAGYDTAIAQYLRQDTNKLPDEMTVSLKKRYDLRYGENPHQPAAFYAEQNVSSKGDTGITWAEQLWGKQLSFNNILDAEATWRTAIDFDSPTVVIVKHTNPCGIASHQNLTKAYRRALSGDPVSAFGGIVAANCKITAETAGEMIDTFYEIVIAPEYEPAALEILKKKKNLRILQVPLPPFSGVQTRYLDYRRVKGGLLVQVSDSLSDEDINLNVVTNRQPTEEEMLDLLFAWKAVKHIKSNAIVFAKDMVLLGMGAGQPNRVVSVKLAGEKAGDKSSGAVMASDAMFPFPDSVEQAAEYGITAIIQPGGSIRDEQSVTAANNHGIAMVFTGTRHFLH